MDVAGLVIAVLAVAVAAATGYFTYRQARAAREQIDIAREDASAARLMAIAANEQAQAARDQAKAAREQSRAASEQAEATNAAVQLERARQIGELAPGIDGVIHYEGPTGHRLELHLVSPRPLKSLSAKIVGTDLIQFVSNDNAVESHTSDFGHVAPGTSVYRWVLVSEPYPETVRLEVICDGGKADESWTLLVDAPVFPDLRQRQPQFAGGIELIYPLPHQLGLQLLSEWPIDFMAVAIVGGYGVKFKKQVTPEGKSPAGVLKERSGPLSRDDIVRWSIILDFRHSGDIELELLCTGIHKEKWVVRQTLEVPDPGSPEFEMSIEEGVPPPRWLVFKLVSPIPLESINLSIGDNANFLKKGQLSNVHAGNHSRPLLGQEKQPQRARLGGFLPNSSARLRVEWTPGLSYLACPILCLILIRLGRTVGNGPSVSMWRYHLGLDGTSKHNNCGCPYWQFITTPTSCNACQPRYPGKSQHQKLLARYEADPAGHRQAPPCPVCCSPS